MKPAIIYARYSPTGRTDCQSLQAQFDQCRRWCSAVGYAVLEKYGDEYASGKDTDREGLRNAMKHAMRAKAILVAVKLDRLGRDVGDLIDMKKKLEKAGATLASVTECVDTSTATGEMMFHVLGTFAQYFRRVGNERTSDAMQSHQRMGRRMNGKGKIPYGMMIDPNDDARMIPCPQEQRVIDKMILMRAGSMSLRQICETLDTAGLFKRDGGSWIGSHNTVSKAMSARDECPV
jgi:DNA invertase Pin-like site-specific DNA recombinase